MVLSGSTAASRYSGETQVSWPWGVCSNPAAPAILGVPSGQVGPEAMGSGLPLPLPVFSSPVPGGPAGVQASPRGVTSLSLGFAAPAPLASSHLSGVLSQVTGVPNAGMGQPVFTPSQVGGSGLGEGSLSQPFTLAPGFPARASPCWHLGADGASVVPGVVLLGLCLLVLWRQGIWHCPWRSTCSRPPGKRY